ncbi:hypothetical protein OZX57_02615 [Bifidobacterium sp. ESL0682]|uniref:hypothetical protein n=1 Tax=Bifidobacterium sp. ESL0682 TaxID=2983212 RepID=UPI0023F6BB07|nr:hypothetical protein [Bifidobacterium sp. ESL0682]WEV42376.1 hypothetical protein OZX57_02615 [Bifidobacterium sp. ESL0682]
MRLMKRFLPSIAVFVTLVAVLATLDAAMTPGWGIEPLTQHIRVASPRSSIQARDTAAARAIESTRNTDIQAGEAGNHTNTTDILKTAQEGTYQVKTTNLHIKLAPNVTINAILRSPSMLPANVRRHCSFMGQAPAKPVRSMATSPRP